VPAVPEPAGTNAGWLVDDVNAAVRALAAAGITVERFPDPRPLVGETVMNGHGERGGTCGPSVS